MKWRLLLLLAALPASVAVAWVPRPGRPTIPNDTYAVAFPASHWPNLVDRLACQDAIRDWKYSGATSFDVVWVANTNWDPENHDDGFSAWGWSSRLQPTTLAATFVRVNMGTNQIVEADVLFNSARSFSHFWGPWRTWNSDFDLGAVARHEMGHALGLLHEDTRLANMGSVYVAHRDIPHIPWFYPHGMLPHADDKNGLRTLYPAAGTVQNLYATCWEVSASAPRRLTLPVTNYAPGGRITVPAYLTNQSNVAIAGGQSGVRAGVFLSTDEFITSSDAKIGEIWFSQPWAPYDEGRYDVTGWIPAATPLGSYWAGVLFDSTNIVNEPTYESDNGIAIGQISVQHGMDLLVDSVSITDATPVRGTSAEVSVTVLNNGDQQTPDTNVIIWLSSDPFSRWRGLRPDDEWKLAAASVPSLAPQQSWVVKSKVKIPDTVAAEQNWLVLATVDPDGALAEIAENNNQQFVDIVPQWPIGPGYYIGQVKRSFRTGVFSESWRAYSKQVGPFTPGITYTFLWTCSGTSPGTPIPPFGTLPLNWDACTDIGLSLLTTPNGLFENMTGPQQDTPEGSRMRVIGDWSSYSGFDTHFAAVYTDGSGQLVAIAPNALEMLIR